ncbi:PaaI family thioesterase [Nitratireductor sp. ZSWI3]|uniref:PaaI family thioesterase n=1 Tax=Nitratireductor sp. ZSWI3 TaxID=2966359 RepID=UPI00214F6E18|nr:PaaI family thioesterase [Nitratireductor sp. ZSWI3]MCR4266657.1 PaaI family thioesterase [Nitratireductor sp. ZSWI3]
MSELLERGIKVLENQPFSKLLGAELILLEHGKAELGVDLRDHHKQQHGFAHGGLVSYLADNALTFAGGSVLGNSVTLEFKINYMRPALGERLLASASLLSSGRRMAVCECRITALHDGVPTTVAVAQGTICKVETE